MRAERRDYVPLLPWLAMPTLVVVGDQDGFTPVADAELMHRTIRTSTLVVIKDSGHITNLEQPDVFNHALGKFLQTVVR
jgi:pimeloyl-ACP methyl ester carboxylesterase